MERGKQIADRFVSSFWRVLTVCVCGGSRQGKARREECLPKQTAVNITKWRSAKQRAESGEQSAERAELRKAFKLRAIDDLILFFLFSSFLYAPYLLLFFFCYCCCCHSRQLKSWEQL